MCGLCGFTGDVDDRDKVLENMTDVITHRGPDSFGYYKDRDNNISMGFSHADLRHRALRDDDLRVAGHAKDFGLEIHMHKRHIFTLRSFQAADAQAPFRSARPSTSSRAFLRPFRNRP